MERVVSVLLFHRRLVTVLIIERILSAQLGWLGLHHESAWNANVVIVLGVS